MEWWLCITSIFFRVFQHVSTTRQINVWTSHETVPAPDDYSIKAVGPGTLQLVMTTWEGERLAMGGLDCECCCCVCGIHFGRTPSTALDHRPVIHHFKRLHWFNFGAHKEYPKRVPHAERTGALFCDRPLFVSASKAAPMGSDVDRDTQGFP